MAKCKYCGQGAGFFRNVHLECQETHEREEKERAALELKKAQDAAKVLAVLLASEAVDAWETSLYEKIDAASGANRDVAWNGVIAWFRHLINEAKFKAGSQERIEAMVASVLDHYGFKAVDLPRRLWARFVRVCACADLDRGIIPARATVAGNLPFNLEAGEPIVWLFLGAEYLEDKVVRSNSHAYSGVSIRVLPGLYTHLGQSASPSISEGFVSIDRGLLAVTDRAILFSGSHKALRTKYKDVVSFTRYVGGFAFCKGTQTARSQAFEVADDLPGFPFVLVHGLAQLRAQSTGRK
jgi:hypothetical protein